MTAEPVARKAEARKVVAPEVRIPAARKAEVRKVAAVEARILAARKAAVRKVAAVGARIPAVRKAEARKVAAPEVCMSAAHRDEALAAGASADMRAVFFEDTAQRPKHRACSTVRDRRKPAPLAAEFCMNGHLYKWEQGEYPDARA